MMKADRVSAWLDGELQTTEVDALVSGVSGAREDLADRVAAYHLIGLAMRKDRDALDYHDHSAALSRLFEAIEAEPPLKKHWVERLRAFFAPDNLLPVLQFNWAPLATAVVVVGLVLFFPEKKVETPVDRTAMNERSVSVIGDVYPLVEASATELDYMAEGKIKDYMVAHESLSPVAISQSSGLASIRSMIYADTDSVMGK